MAWESRWVRTPQTPEDSTRRHEGTKGSPFGSHAAHSVPQFALDVAKVVGIFFTSDLELSDRRPEAEPGSPTFGGRRRG
ncbi:MAG TPA: hypothetical protein PLO61_08295, partial [Fimbriimonadaceae bacterium]|nr:hypothetical protein [Fimbriimonadaceae bacterium]HRJ33471.1 hypothetical protein [Fimbriimonadaceae bacterium]